MPNQRLPWLSFLVVAASSIVGCAAAYKPLGYSGGYSDVQLDPTTFRVAFSGNGFTSRERVETYLLRRCAELTIKRGYNYFVILGGDTSSANSVINMPSSTTGSVTVVGNTAYWNGTTTPGQQIPITKYGAAVAMRVFIDRPSELQGVFDARLVAAYLAPKPKVRRPEVVAHSAPPIAPAAPTTGMAPLGGARVTIESTPENAEIYVDGSLVGMTPLPAYPIAAGTRRIGISRKGFVTWRRDLVVPDGVETRLNAELEASMDPSFQEPPIRQSRPQRPRRETSIPPPHRLPPRVHQIDGR